MNDPASNCAMEDLSEEELLWLLADCLAGIEEGQRSEIARHVEDMYLPEPIRQVIRLIAFKG